MTKLKTLKDIETLDMKEHAFANSLRQEVIKWIKHIQAEPYPIFPDKEVKIPWFGEELTLRGRDQIFAAKAVLQSLFNIKEDDLK